MPRLECEYVKRILLCSSLALIVVLLSLTVRTSGECNVCSATSGLACVSGTQFQVCLNGLPQGSVISCPATTVCSTVGNSICQFFGANTIQACQDCNKCDATNTFACTSPTTYVLCLGTTTPTQLAGTCAPNYVCNIENSFICGNTALGVLPTCSALDNPTTTPSPTTPSPAENPINYCRSVMANGRFPVGTNITSTCRQYVYCFPNNGTWFGQLYQCPGVLYFNSTSRLCERGLPQRCNTTVQGFALLNF